MIRFSLKIPKSNAPHSYTGKTVGIIHVEMKFDAMMCIRIQTFCVDQSMFVVEDNSKKLLK